jgi:hypothetical protein
MELEDTSPEFAADLQDVWDSLPQSVKDLSASIYNSDVGGRYTSDYQARHEFFRQYWQNEDLRRITESSLQEEGVFPKLAKLLDTFIKELKRLAKGADANLKPILDRLIAQATQRANELRTAAGQPTQTNESQANLPPDVAVRQQREEGEGAQETTVPKQQAEKGSEQRASEGEEDTISNKNADVNRKREERGEDPLVSEEERKWTVAENEARAILKKNPKAGEQLVEALQKHPRAMTDTENAILLFHRAKLDMMLKELRKEVIDATSEQAREEAIAKRDKAEDEFNQADIVDRISGTESGRSLNARKMTLLMKAQDITLSNLLQIYRNAKGGTPLTQIEREKVEKNADALQKAEANVLKAETAKIAKEWTRGRSRSPKPRWKAGRRKLPRGSGVSRSRRQESSWLRTPKRG